jgi:hypothetical protein
MFRISDTIRRTQTPDGAVLLDIERGQIVCLDLVGATILDLLGAGCDEGRIAAQVSAAYGTDIDTVRVDVHDFLEALSRQCIISKGDPVAIDEREGTHGRTRPT